MLANGPMTLASPDVKEEELERVVAAPPVAAPPVAAPPVGTIGDLWAAFGITPVIVRRSKRAASKKASLAIRQCYTCQGFWHMQTVRR